MLLERKTDHSDWPKNYARCPDWSALCNDVEQPNVSQYLLDVLRGRVQVELYYRNGARLYLPSVKVSHRRAAWELRQRIKEQARLNV